MEHNLWCDCASETIFVARTVPWSAGPEIAPIWPVSHSGPGVTIQFRAMLAFFPKLQNITGG
eukprot:4316122-Prymnesium_polylepis.1